LGNIREEQRQRLLETKVDSFLKVVAKTYGLLPKPQIYEEFVLGKDGRTLYLKEGLKRVTHQNDSSQYLDLKGLGPADWIRTHLFRTNQCVDNQEISYQKYLPPQEQ